MIGQNDVAGEVFYLDDAADLKGWAIENQINRLAMWSVNRDRECVSPSDPLYSCSHIPQMPYEFSGIFGAGIPTPTPGIDARKGKRFQNYHQVIKK